MKFSVNWLRTLVNSPLPNTDLSHVLTMAGLEVEALEPVAPPFSGVVVAKILTVEPHPNADRLRICRVDVGAGEPLQIVCGAPNAAAGLTVPCAQVGAVLPAMLIKQAKVRGVESSGMLCSAQELGLMEESAGLMILSATLAAGTDLRQALDLDDATMTLKLTPNRSDCLGMVGIAREVAAITDAPLVGLNIEPILAGSGDRRSVTLQAPEGCPLYCGRVVHLDHPAATVPAWIKQRLLRSGLRSISTVVDVTNYVMLEMGQPLHAFDLDKIAGNVVVRWARPSEPLRLLNQQQVELTADCLVIADEHKALALAGIMGGEDSEVGDQTRSIFLESAFFSPEAIIGRARRLGLSSDAAHRFERGVDFAAPRLAMERATQLLLQICGGKAGEVSQAMTVLPARNPVNVRASRVCRVLGIALSASDIAALFQRLQFNFEQAGDVLRVTPPSFRFDLSIEEDFIEEVARVYGYDRIPSLPPVTPLTMLPVSEASREPRSIRDTLVNRDFQEVVTYSFVEREWEQDFSTMGEPIALQNPIASQMSVMRTTLIGGLIGALRHNLNRKEERVRLFEIGRCFHPAQDVIDQPQMLAALCDGNVHSEQWGEVARQVDFFDLKADVAALFAPRTLTYLAQPHPALHPGRSARLMLAGQPIGWLGELHPSLLQKYELTRAPVVFEVELTAALAAAVPSYREVSKFPPVRRDVAVVVDEGTAAQALIDALQGELPATVIELSLFDVYRGKGIDPGKKSLAFLVLMQDTQKTLTDDDADSIVEKMTQILSTRFKAQLRT